MLNRGILSLLIAALALLASPGLAPPVAGQDTLVVDDDGWPACVDAINVYTSISDALVGANPGDTIHVCPGDYTEPSMTIDDNELKIEGSGPSVTHLHSSGGMSGALRILADRVVVQGLDVDAGASSSYGIFIGGDSVTIQNNEIRNAKLAVNSLYPPERGYVQVLSNNIHDSNHGVECIPCDDSAFSGNTVKVNGATIGGIWVGGHRNVITSNVVVDGSVAAWGEDVLVAQNQISGATLHPLLSVSGNRVGVTDNTLSDTTGYAIEASTDPFSSTSVTIARNTFTEVAAPIHLRDWDPGDTPTLTATIGGSASEANTFIDSGGSLGDSNYLVQMDGAPLDVNAEYNKWGLCTADEIEQEIYDKADDPALGAVDYEPFIKPDDCAEPSTPTPTATPTRTPTPTATPGATATPIPGPTRTVTIPPGGWANFVWSGASSPQTVADCFGAGNVAVMYRLDAATGSFQRWVRGREELSNMGDVQRFDALLALNAGAQPATCIMPDDVVPHSLTIPAGRWANFAWLSVSFPAEVAPEACSEGSIAVIYRLDALTQTFQRWIRGRPDLSNMGEVQPYDALLALNGSGQAASCSFTHYGQLALFGG